MQRSSLPLLLALSIVLLLPGCEDRPHGNIPFETSPSDTHTSPDVEDTHAEDSTEGDTEEPDIEEPLCGNGRLDAGESCDYEILSGAGSCPTACISDDPCLSIRLAGAPFSCTAICVGEQVTTSCTDDDTCCPNDCNNASDNDCVAIVDCTQINECIDNDTCCPSSCNNTSDNDCEAPTECSQVTECTHDDTCCPPGCDNTSDNDCETPTECRDISECIDSDTCCPSGCDNASDNDCSVIINCDEINACIDGDTCCPNTCDGDSDNDCPPLPFCGDGRLDSGENCDPAIPTGATGACPELCNPQSVCMVGELQGTPENCDATCQDTPFAECVHDDGCCGSGCSGEADNDCLNSWACNPSTSLNNSGYEGTAGLNDDALKAALLGLIDGHNSLSYSPARDLMFGVLDVNPDGLLEGIYTGTLTPPDGTRTPGGFNTEHSWPQGGGEHDGGAASEPAKSDLHHLYPTLGTANSARASHPFGMTDCGSGGPSCSWEGGGSQLGISTSSADLVFEVRPKYRGDIARSHFYFSIRYGYAILPEEENILRAWHCEDPPDAVERARLEGIANAQFNRNPFIDRPDLVDRISDF